MAGSFLFPNVKINPDAKKVSEIFIGKCTLTKKDQIYIVSKEGESKSYILKLYKQSESFLAETNTLKALEDYKNFPKLIYSNEQKEFFFNIITKLPGEDLFDYFVNKDLKLNKKLLITKKIAKKVLLLLQVLHENNILHGDIKPENILYDEKTDDAYLIDFDGRLTRAFISPQIVKGKNNKKENYILDKKDDMWALGVTLYYILTNNNPFANDKEILNKCIIMRPDWEELGDFLLCLLDKDADTRYSVEECLKHPLFLDYTDLK